MAEEIALTGEPPAAPPVDNTPVDRAPAPRFDWWAEVKGLFWLIVAVLGFHSFIAKPFYIPSESMLPGLMVGDRLVVNKFAYGWSYVSPTIPNPLAIFRSLVLRQPQDSWSVQIPFRGGRLWGKMPERGDVVVFMVGKTVLVACVHGEGDTAVRQRGPMLEALKTVKAP